MTSRFIASMAALAAASFGASTWTVPRTPDGQPDLQGIWTNSTLTPFERPAAWAGKEFLTEKEAADYEERVIKDNDRDRRGGTAETDVAGAYNNFWFERGTKVVPSQANFPDCRSAGWEGSRADTGCEGRQPQRARRWAAIRPRARRTSACPSAASCGPPQVRPWSRAVTTTTIRFCRIAGT